MRNSWRWLLLGAFVLGAAGGAYFYRRAADSPREPLLAGAADEVVVLDASKPFALKPPPPGWRHRTFWTVRPMRLAFANAQGVPALRCETDASASIYGRWTDIDLSRFPVLTWRWQVEVPISSTRDEATREGDDHPVRLFVEFRDTQGAPHRAEIIWGNRKFKRGDWKYIGEFPHYTADGGDENIGRWRDERVDLVEMYRTFSKRTDTPRLAFLGVFCDSDNTGGRSVAYTADMRLKGI